MSETALVRGLNAAQRAAVTAPLGATLVRAGAGTGKTRVLTLRIAYLLSEQQVPASRLLALTFTNKAAAELRARVGNLPGQRTRGLTAGTFHAVCARLLRAEIGGRLGNYTADFSIYATDEQLQLAAAALESVTERPPVTLEPPDLLRLISRAKSRLHTPRLLARRTDDPLAPFVAACYRRYQRSLERANALDFDDLIMLTHRLLSEHPDVLEHYQHQWQHILVDEYQDTDPAQYGVLALLASPLHHDPAAPRSLFVVGDSMQAIYGFRNADYTIITRFTSDFPAAHEYNLQTNYRSRQPILDAAYAVIRHSQTVQPMTLHAASSPPPESCLFLQECSTARDEAEQIARQIDDLLRSGRTPGEVAILYRARHLSRPLETALRHARIPYRVRGSTGFYDRAVIRDALAYLRCIANPADSLSLSRIANRPARGLGAQALARLASYAAEQGSTLRDALAHPAAHATLSSRAAAGAATLAGLLTRWQTRHAQGYPPENLLTDVLEQSGYMADLAERLPADELAEAREHLSELLNAAAEHTSLRDLLQEIALLTSTDDDDDPTRQKVDLLTIHAAKGLEWNHVFVAGMEEGTLPHERSLTTAAGIEEERRLCYVALTRAGERLFLSWATRRNRGKTAAPSRFIEEITAYGRQRAQQAAAGGRT